MKKIENSKKISVFEYFCVMIIFEQELGAFISECGVPHRAECVSGLQVFLCRDGAFALVAVPMDYFPSGGTVDGLECAGRSVCAGETVFLYEDRWLGSGPLVRSMLRVRLGQGRRVYARNCEVRPVSAETAAAFLKRNHIYGSARAGTRLGLFRLRSTGAGEAAMDSTPQLVEVAAFSKGRRMENGLMSYEWVRCASERGVRVAGGMGRLLEAFAGIAGRSGMPFEVMTYSDREWYDGRSYAAMGFEEAGLRPPVAFLCAPDGSRRVHEGKFQTDRRYRKEADSCGGMVRILNLGSCRYVRRFGQESGRRTP